MRPILLLGCLWFLVLPTVEARRRARRPPRPASDSLPRPQRRPPAAAQERTRILGDLKNPDPKRRADAAWEAGQRRLRGAYPTLRRMLRDGEPGVRRSAAYALGLLGNREAVLALYDRIIREKSPTVLAALAVALGRLRYRTARPLIAGLTWNANPILRSAGITGLGYLGDPEDVSTLRRFLRHRDPGLRRSAARALGHLGQPAARRLLRPLLTDPNGSVQAAAIEALARLDSRSDADAVARHIDNPTTPVRRAAVLALRRLGSRRHIDVIGRRMKVDADDIAAEAALTVAHLGGEVPATRLRHLLQSRHNAVRVAATRAAGLAGVREAIPDLARMLTHPHLALRIAAIRALGRLAAYQTRDQLLKRLRMETGIPRAALLQALGRLRAVDAIAAVVPLLDDSDPQVVAAASRTIADMARLDPRPLAGLARRFEPLLRPNLPAVVLIAAADAFSLLATRRNRQGFVRLQRLTFHPDLRVRTMAARGLGRYGDHLAGPALERLLRDPSPAVQNAAAMGLVRMRLHGRRRTGRRTPFPTCASQPPLLAATCVLIRSRAQGRIDGSAGKVLRRALLGAPNTPERAALVPLISETGARGSLAVLEEARRAPCYLVRAAARRALSIWPPAVAETPPPQTARPRSVPTTGTARRGADAPRRKTDRPFAGGPGRGCGCQQRSQTLFSSWIQLLALFMVVAWRRRRSNNPEV